MRHIWCRGNRKQQIFRDDADCEHYLSLFEKVAVDLKWRVVAYCLMPNHIHLMVDFPADTMAKGMQILQGEYAQYVNRRHDYDGHLWRGRYSVKRVETDAYSLQLNRYIVNNPVRAGIVDSPAAWKWSSYRAMVGKTKPPPYLDTQWTLRQFSDHPERARIRYEEFVDAGRRLPYPPKPPTPKPP
jgi:REP element-mobilizing transposase RayT